MIHAYSKEIFGYLAENRANPDISVLRYGVKYFLNELLSSGLLLLIDIEKN